MAQAANLVGDWTFSDPYGGERTGYWDPVFLLGNARIENGQLVVSGTGDGSGAPTGWAESSYFGPPFRDRTLVAWVQLDDSAIQSGAPLGLNVFTGHDALGGPGQFAFWGAIAYSEFGNSMWEQASDDHSFGEFHNNIFDTNTGPGSLRQVAVSYRDEGNGLQTVTGCLNGVDLGSSVTASFAIPDQFGRAPTALFGPNHLDSHANPVGSISAHIDEARIYDAALSCSQVVALTDSSTRIPLDATPPNTLQAEDFLGKAHARDGGPLVVRGNSLVFGAHMGSEYTVPFKITAPGTYGISGSLGSLGRGQFRVAIDGTILGTSIDGSAVSGFTQGGSIHLAAGAHTLTVESLGASFIDLDSVTLFNSTPLPGAEAPTPGRVAPTATIVRPADGARYSTTQTVTASYSCSDVAPGAIAAGGCSATVDGVPVADGTTLPTSDDGHTHTFALTVTDDAGNQRTYTRHYTAENFAQLVLDDDPVAYFRLGDGPGSSTFADASTNDHTGEFKNATESEPSGVSGDHDTARHFLGSDGYGYVNDVQAPTAASTLMSWVRFDTAATESSVLDHGYDNAIFLTGGHFAFRHMGTTIVDQTSPAVVANRWYLVVGRWDGHRMDLFVADQTQSKYQPPTLVASALNTLKPSGSSTFYLGYGQDEPWLQGSLDEVMYFDAAISDAHLAELWLADPPAVVDAPTAPPASVASSPAALLKMPAAAPRRPLAAKKALATTRTKAKAKARAHARARAKHRARLRNRAERNRKARLGARGRSGLRPRGGRG